MEGLIKMPQRGIIEGVLFVDIDRLQRFTDLRLLDTKKNEIGLYGKIRKGKKEKFDFKKLML